MLQLPLDIQLDSSARLDNFYIGNHSQLFQRLKNLISTSDNFLFIWGAAQVGKSHLAQAICAEYSEKNLTTAYFPLDNSALVPDVLQGFEFADIVCLDSFHCIAEDLEWQQAVFNLFNDLKNEKHQLIIFCQQSPFNILLQLADLKSRLNSMEVYKLESLNENQRIDFLMSTANYRGLDISSEIAQFILARTSRDVKNLIELVDRLDVQSITQQRKVTVPFVKKVLKL